MKKIMYQHLPLSSSFILLFFLFLSAGCKKSDSFSSLNAQNQSSLSAQAIQRVDLVANKSIYGALHIDHNLLNAWGMSADDEGNIWVSAADGGISYVYNKKGGHEMPPVPFLRMKQIPQVIQQAILTMKQMILLSGAPAKKQSFSLQVKMELFLHGTMARLQL